MSTTACLVVLTSSASASDAEEIRAFLTVPVQARLTAALEAADHRYLGLYGFSLEVPGVPDFEVPGSEEQILVIPGTSDDGEFALNDLARDYAAEYNRMLRSRSSSPEPLTRSPPNEGLQRTVALGPSEDRLFGPDLFGVRMGMPYQPESQIKAADIEIDSSLTIRASPLIGSCAHQVGGFNIHHDCTDLDQCIRVAEAILNRLREQGYPPTQVSEPPGSHLHEWRFEDESFWLSVGVWREPERSDLTFSTWVWRKGWSACRSTRPRN